MNIFEKLFERKTASLTLTSDRQPRLPYGATGIITHETSFAKNKSIGVNSITTVSMPSGVSYEYFVESNSNLEFVDATILDLLIEYAEKNKLALSELVKLFLGDFAGQLFFLNTKFDSRDGGAFAFLNWKTELPAFRCLCPAHNPIRPDIPVYAAVVS